jgi:uncharacterized protein (TIGR03067 family)
MKTLRILLMALLAAFASGATLPEDSPAVNAELARLQGEWTMVSGSADGQPMPDDMRQQMRRVCVSNEVTVTMGDTVFPKAKITVDPTKNPKTIDYVMTGGFSAGKTQLGIYDIHGDSFTSAFASPGAPRPRDFSGKPGDGKTISV